MNTTEINSLEKCIELITELRWTKHHAELSARIVVFFSLLKSSCQPELAASSSQR